MKLSSFTNGFGISARVGSRLGKRQRPSLYERRQRHPWIDCLEDRTTPSTTVDLGIGGFILPAPTITSVVVNGGENVVLSGTNTSQSLAGQDSVVKQILVTFDQDVALDAGAFTVAPRMTDVVAHHGVSPSLAAVSANIAAVSGSQFLVTFSGAGTHDGGIINDGVYQLVTIASKVHAGGQTMPSDRIDTFLALYANHIIVSPSGSGAAEAFVDGGGFAGFVDAFNSRSDVAGPPTYNVAYDYNLDGYVNGGDFAAFVQVFNVDWTYTTAVPAPTIASVAVNGGGNVVLSVTGTSQSLAGQDSVVKQVLVTFDQSVSLDAGAFTVAPRTTNVTVHSGIGPSLDAVTASFVAVNSTQYLVTFSGVGTHHDGILNDGVYELTTVASKVHTVDGRTMANDQTDIFLALYANHSTLSINGTTEAFVDGGGFAGFVDTYNSRSDETGPPHYNVAYDYNLDGFVDGGDFAAFVQMFNVDWEY